MECDHCKKRMEWRQFMLVGDTRMGLCGQCAALVKINTQRTKERVNKMEPERTTAAQEERALMADLDALVRSRKPTGSAWWWR